MQGGDLSNELPPRFVFVLEGLVATVPASAVRRQRLHLRLHRWEKAVDLLEWNTYALSTMWNTVWRLGVRFDVATYTSTEQGWLEALRDRLDQENVPVSTVHAYSSPQELALKLAYLPDVRAVFDAAPERALVYGNRGRTAVPDSFSVI